MPLAPEADLRSIVPILRPSLSEQPPTIQVERISPKTSPQARHGTLSARYGLGPFPLHTERAHWRSPPRYLIFRSVGEVTDRPTTLLDSYALKADKKLVQELLETQWIVQWGDDSFRSPVLTPLPTPEQWQIRYDRCCMSLSEDAPPELNVRLDQTFDSLIPEHHFWRLGEILLIDNWRMLHGRGTSAVEDFGRVLERIVVP